MGYNKMTLHGGQVCDYLYIENSEVLSNDFSVVDSEPKEWNPDTVMLSRFDNESLSAGNTDLDGKIEGYEIRRRKGASSHTEHVATIQKSNHQFIIDYLAANNSTYTYYIYPNSSNVMFTPSESQEVKTNWGYWSLLVVDESPEEDVYYLSKMFKFELNVTPEEMNNNTNVTVTQNFTKHPTIQYSTSNYWSSSLSALCGFISCGDYSYVQTLNMIEELKSLTSDTRKKFLKDMDGNVWEIKITSPVSVSPMDVSLQQVKNVKISWAEVGSATGISVINNPNLPTTEWLLTETGEAVPYIDYMWDEQYIWDDSYRWTAKDDLLETEVSNLGRKLFDKDGDM